MKLRAVSVLALFVALVSQHAEAGQQTYQHPPESLAQLVDAPITPAVRPTPDGQMLLLLHRPSFPSIAECAQQELRLAGTRINPAVLKQGRVFCAAGPDEAGRGRGTRHYQATRTRRAFAVCRALPTARISPKR